MKLSTKEIIEASAALKKLGAVPLSGLVSYRVAKCTKALQPIATAFEEAQNKLLERYSEPAKDAPGRVTLTDPKAFSEEITPMLEEEVEVNFPHTFKLADFGEAKIEPSIFVALDRWITET